MDTTSTPLGFSLNSDRFHPIGEMAFRRNLDVNIKVFAITSFIFAILFAGGGGINPLIYQASIYIRTGLLLLSIFLALVILGRQRVVSRKATLVVLAIAALVIFYLPTDRLTPELIDGITRSAIAIVIAYMMSSVQLSGGIKIHNLSIVLVFAYLAAIFMGSGVTVVGYVPTIAFTVIDKFDSVGFYSQEITKIFSVGIIAVFFKILYEKASPWYLAPLIFLFFLFGLFSLAGGSRGEVIFCVVTLLFMLLLSRTKESLFVGIGLLFLMAIAVAVFFETLETLPSIFRLLSAYENSYLGQRDDLADQAFQLLAQNPRCLWIGCGLTFFQDYYNYGADGYPHNWIIEFVVTFGSITLIVLAFLAIRFVVRNYRYFSVNEKFLFFLTFYFFAVRLKSGTLVDSGALYGSLFPLLFSMRYSMGSSTGSSSEPDKSAL